MTSRGTRAIDVLNEAGIEHVVHEYEPTAPGRSGGRGTRPAYGRDAADKLPIDADRICKTLVVEADGRLACAIVPVSAELDLKRVADALGARRAGLADPAAAERATGYVRGGISPFGQRRPLPTVLDSSAADRDTILVSAGRRGLQVEVSPRALVALLDAMIAPIARSEVPREPPRGVSRT